MGGVTCLTMLLVHDLIENKLMIHGHRLSGNQTHDEVKNTRRNEKSERTKQFAYEVAPKLNT